VEERIAEFMYQPYNVIKARILAIYLSLQYNSLSILKIEMGRGTHLPSNWWLVVTCHTSCVNIWVCSKHATATNSCCYKHILLQRTNHLQFGWDGYSLIKQMGNSPNKWLKLLQYLKSNYITNIISAHKLD
jgi:hypothetical protein